MRLSAVILVLLLALAGLGSLLPTAKSPASPRAAAPPPAATTSRPGPIPSTPEARSVSGPRPALQPGGEIFDQPTVVDFRFHLTRPNRRALRDHPRDYTPVTVVINGVTFTNVAVKLKGAAGSYRSVDDRPALTLSLNRFVPGRRLFGLRRLHLNNSVQDPSYLNEYVASELFRAAGVPTARVAWATVRFGDEDLGLYVLKEAFEKELLRCFFANPHGNLYDGGFLRDIDQKLERDSGYGPSDHSDLASLAAIAEERDAPRRWARLQQALDVYRFATYAALSAMLVDWDGYPLNRNNYRVYFNPEDGRAVFMPHGMDQILQRTYLELDQGWAGLLAWAVFSTDPGQALYEARCRELFRQLFTFDRVSNLVARASSALEAVRPDMPRIADAYHDQVRSRLRVLRRDPLLTSPPPSTVGTRVGASQVAQDLP